MNDQRQSSVANLLSTVFANDIALSDEAIARYMTGESMRPDAPYGEAIRRELVELYTSPNTDWAALMENRTYEVFSDATQEAGRNFVTERIWNLLFPDEKDNPPTPTD